MADIFKFYIVPLTDTDKNVVNAAAMRLNTYFGRIIQKMTPRIFKDTQFGTSTATAASITDLDLVVYVVGESLILRLDPTQKISANAGGATAQFGDGTMLSEVYWPRVKQFDAKHIALANFAFHEFAHNKFDGTGKNPHAYGGGGLLGWPLMKAAINGSSPSTENEKFMADNLNRQVRQSTIGFFNEQLGF